MWLDLALEISTSISDVKEVPGPDEAAHRHPEKQPVITEGHAKVIKDVSLVVLVLVVLTFLICMIRVLVE